MKQECPTYLKTIGKSKALSTTLSDTEPEDELDDNNDEGILNAFTAIVNPTEGIVEEVDEEKDFVEFKFKKMDEQDDIHTTYAKLYKISDKHEKLYRLATKKLSDKADQTIGVLRFENNFLVERTKKLEAELFQFRVQLERTYGAKFNEMHSFQKSASDKTGLGYDFSSPNIASSSTFLFVSSTNNIASENVDKGKSILGAPPTFEKKETRIPRTKKVNNKKSQPKKPHLCHHCGASRHTCPNCYKWLATQKSNNMISSRNHNQFPSSFAPLGDLFKTLMFLSNLNSFNFFPSPPDQSDLVTFSLSPLMVMHYLYVLLSFS